MLVLFINIDFLAIGNPCNNFGKCNQCFLGDEAGAKGDLEVELDTINSIMEANPNANFFFYPAEFATSRQYTGLMLGTGQKAMTNGKRKGIAEIISSAGFKRVSFSLYSDIEEMKVFYNYNENVYSNLLENIQSAADLGLEVEIFSIVTSLNYEKLPRLYELASGLGVKKISLLPLVPLGNAKDMETKLFLDQKTLEKVIETVDTLKTGKNPYISMSIGFGITEKSVERYLLQEIDSWSKTDTLCPAIGGKYATVNVAEKEVYWCFKVLNESWGKIGKVNDDGNIELNPTFDLSAEALKKNLTGICGDCYIKNECFGGCRSQAVSFALMQNPGMPIEEAIYAGQPFCRYQVKKTNKG